MLIETSIENENVQISDLLSVSSKTSVFLANIKSNLDILNARGLGLIISNTEPTPTLTYNVSLYQNTSLYPPTSVLYYTINLANLFDPIDNNGNYAPKPTSTLYPSPYNNMNYIVNINNSISDFNNLIKMLNSLA